MELREPRRGFSLDALIAEAKRRARQRRLLITVLLLIGAAAAAAVVVVGSQGGGSRSGGPAGLGSGSSGSTFVRVGALALTIPRGFSADKISCPIRHCRLTGLQRVLVSNRPVTAASSPIYPANRVVLDLSYLGASELARTRPPLNLHQFRRMGRASGAGTAWSQIVSAGGSTYSVTVFVGSKAPAADRASVLRALGLIHRAH